MGSTVIVIPGLSSKRRSALAVVKNLGILMEAKADAVTAVLPDHGEAVRLHVMLNRVADITQARAWADFLDSQPHALVCDTRESLGQDLAFTDEKHSACITVIAVLNYRDVDVFKTSPFLSTRSPGMP